jgi:hypothetical protein
MTRLEQLLSQWEEGTLTTQGLAELKELLATAEGRAALVDDWLLNEAIYGKLRAAQDEAAPAVASQTPDPFPAGSSVHVRPRQGWLDKLLPALSWRQLPVSLRVSLGTAGAVGLVLIGTWFYFLRTPAAAIIDGMATVEHGSAKRPLQPGQGLYPGDLLRVPAGGAAVLAWNNEATRLRLDPGTELQVLGWARGRQFVLRQGRLQAAVAAQSRWRPLSIRTPQAEATVVGTCFSMDVSQSATRLEVTGGAVALRKTQSADAPGPSRITVRAGEFAVATLGGEMKTEAISHAASREVLAIPPAAPAQAPAPALVVWSDLVSELRITAGSVRVPPTTSGRYEERVRCYLTPAVTGPYIFWLHSGRPSELWLSTDDDPARRKQIAFVPRPAAAAGAASKPGAASWQLGPATTVLHPSQRSVPQSLQAGVRYYLEVLAEHDPKDLILVNWAKPGEPTNAPSGVVDRSVLSPFFETASRAGAPGQR